MNSLLLPELTPLQRRKRAAILNGAKAIFLQEGFGLATMDDVAAAAGVGKQTVYRHFGSKEALFAGLVRFMCAEVGSVASARGEQSDRSAEVELRELGWLLVRNLIAPDSLGLYRAIVAEAGRLPELGEIFYENGPKLVRGIAARILRKQFKKGIAGIRASTFVQLVLGDAHLEMTLGYKVPNIEARFEQQIEEAIHAALRQ
jgi:AcrR family transcriptional regulator